MVMLLPVVIWYHLISGYHIVVIIHIFASQKFIHLGFEWYTVSPWATLPLGPKISQKQCCSSYVLKISVVQGIISVAQEILQKTVKSALLKVNTELFKNRVVSRTALLEVVLLKDLLYWSKFASHLCGLLNIWYIWI